MSANRAVRRFVSLDGVQLVQVPPKSAVGARFGQPDIAYLDNRPGEEVLRGLVKPGSMNNAY